MYHLRTYVALLLMLLCACGCGGGGSGDDAVETTPEPTASGVSPLTFLGYFSDNDKQELETTAEYQERMATKLQPVRETTVLLPIERGGYDADTQLLSFRLDFTYSARPGAVGPGLLLRRTTADLSSGGTHLIMHSSGTAVFVNMAEGATFQVLDGLAGACTSTRRDFEIHETISCDLTVPLPRDTVAAAAFTLALDLQLETLLAVEAESSNVSGTTVTTYRDTYCPASLREITLIEETSGRLLGRLRPASGG